MWMLWSILFTIENWDSINCPKYQIYSQLDTINSINDFFIAFAYVITSFWKENRKIKRKKIDDIGCVFTKT